MAAPDDNFKRSRVAATMPRERSFFREQRAAQNQSLFREVNERIEPINKSFSAPNAPNEFVCECANEACTAHLQLSIDEYEAVRAHPDRFAVMPDDRHVLPEVERVAEKHERYWVVEKLDSAGEVAAQLDPRSREA